MAEFFHEDAFVIPLEICENGKKDNNIKESKENKI